MTAVIDTPVRTPLSASTTRAALRVALDFIKPSVATRPIVPVMAGVLLRMDGDLLVSGFDYEVAATFRAPAQGTGQALVNYAELVKCAKAFDQKDVTLEVEGDSLAVSDGETTYRLDLLPIDDYVALPTAPESEVGSVTGEELTRLARVTIAAGRDDTLPVLMGVQFSTHDGQQIGQLEAAATDRYRLAVQTVEASAEIRATILVPAKALDAVAKAFGTSSRVFITAHYVEETGYRGAKTLITERVRFSDGEQTFDVRTLGGEFPNYRRLFPTEWSTSVTYGAKVMQQAITKVAIMAPRNAPVRLGIGTDVVVTAESDGKVRAERRVAADLTGDPMPVVAYNPGYLLDGLKLLGGVVQHAINSPTRPAVLTNSEEVGLRYLVMPVRTSS